MITKRQIRSNKQSPKIKRNKKKIPEMIEDLIDRSDIILYILDARFIKETRNKETEQLIKKKGKKIIYVLNKVDLIETNEISEVDLEDLKPRVFVSAIRRYGGNELRNWIKSLSKKLVFKKGEALIGVIGYPNTGKSSIINLLIGKNSAKTAITAGFTKGLQRLKLSQGIILIDSPGVIPAKEYSNSDQMKMVHNAMVGARDYNSVKEPELVVDSLVSKYKVSFEKYYQITLEEGEDFVEKFGMKKSVFKKKGEVNMDRAARLILRDWQEGKIRVVGK